MRDQVVVYTIKDEKNELSSVVREIMKRFNLSLSGKKILIKPNLVSPRSAAVTSVELIRSVIETMLEMGGEVMLGEGSGYEFNTNKCFEILGIWELGKKYGIPVINLRKEEKYQTHSMKGKVLKRVSLPKIVSEIDGIINLPKIKTHALTDFTCGMKNLMGLLPDEERRKMHVFGLHQAIVDLSNYLFEKILLTICDGTEVMGGQGPTFGDVFKANFVLASRNVFLADYIAAKIVGLDPDEIKYLSYAEKQGLLPRHAVHDFYNDLPELKIQKTSASRFYRFEYWLVYAFDYTLSRIFWKSLIPEIVTRFGTKLKIEKEKCITGCRECIKVCPVKAISEDLEISFEKCRYVRCFRCYEVCPVKGITVIGRSKPAERREMEN